MGKEKAKVDRRMCKRHWTLDEETKLLDYLIENNPIEMPTPKVYYTKLIKERKLDRNYVLIKNKVASMKKAYYKLLDWKRIAIEKGAKVESDYRLIDEYVERKCPNFKKLEIICSPDFPVKEQQTPSNIHNVEEINFLTDTEDTFEGFKDIKDEIEEPDDELSIPDPLEDLQSLIDPSEETEDTEETEETNEDEKSLRRMELEIEKEKLAIEREKIAMQREKNQEEAKFKVLQLQQEGILKRLQVEKDAELKKYELSLKYKAKPESEM